VSWAAPVEAWREAFQSSPAAYAPVTPELEKLLVEKLHFTPERVLQLRSKPPLSGTLRFRLSLSAGGSKVRVRLSNEEGSKPLALAGASVGLAATGFDARAGSLRTLTFGGKRGVTIPAGAPVISDQVDLSVIAGSALVVSIIVAGELALAPLGGGAMAHGAGDQNMQTMLAGEDPVVGRPFVTGVMILSAPPARVIAAIGDSITDANHAFRGAETGSWPEALAPRLAARTDGRGHAIVNAGIGGNRLLGTGSGQAILARLDRDVLRIDGLSHVIMLAGTNDVGSGSVLAEDLISGYRQVIARVHGRGARLLLATLPPFRGDDSHFSVEKERVRQAVNSWIRSSGEPDGVVDFDKVLRDPDAPERLRPAYDSGDHLHPSSAGYKAMADAIELGLLD
jgi:lysophospholipase L1-like esterase